MKALPSIAFSGFRGTASEVTARQVWGRTVLSGRAQHPHVKTPGQSLRRASFSFISKQHHTLTDSQRKAWNRQAIMALRDEPVTDYEDIYHDSFEDCRMYFDRLQSKIPDYTLLGLYRTPDNHLRCKKDNCLYSIDEHTLAAEPALP